ncbi:MAG TPA: UDP-N-acetylglucosamine--N-acetylmuramyl-(pentapeptide) pyrophosphoryl-undecaprenol N-acetylglucosamine transferase [Candidatus Saccharimonadales bacterium]|nr:UDP-N-acetylglucosamine--N-acetylmuramyl-(pentapeptide) pyrophosphoryl-undecaprenol N-acetylglucosamine transferase [Candidatus Saccharimonadales bacterium]
MTTIVMTGGGSGGHITPILAVAAELKKLQPDCNIVYIGQKGDGLGDVPAQSSYIDAVYTVRAGKFRRYHQLSLRRYWRVKLVSLILNTRDMVWVVVGTIQSYWLLKRLHPASVFVKGGFVGVPVGLAAAACHIPFVTHDSDAVPGLANRIVARWARVHAVALPKDVYHYPAERTVTVGVPVQSEFEEVTPARAQHYRKEIGLHDDERLLFIIGGGLGARPVNDAALQCIPGLLEQFSNLVVVHAAGRANAEKVAARYDELLPKTQRGRIVVKDYLTDVYRYSGAAEVVITRAGATNLAEFAVQHKACVVIPHPNLVGGHQVKNARYLAEQGAIVVVEEARLAAGNELGERVAELLRDEARRHELEAAFGAFAKPDASHHLAMILLEQSSTRNT